MAGRRQRGGLNDKESIKSLVKSERKKKLKFHATGQNLSSAHLVGILKFPNPSTPPPLVIIVCNNQTHQYEQSHICAGAQCQVIHDAIYISPLGLEKIRHEERHEPPQH
jgi:hypothetical protein